MNIVFKVKELELDLCSFRPSVEDLALVGLNSLAIEIRLSELN